MKKDINGREEIQEMVDLFYTRIREDEALGFIFDDTMHVNWQEHLPKMYDFWETVLFGTISYKGNPMAAHIRVDQQIPLQPEHFSRWVELFNQTIDELFEGRMAEQVKLRAQSIANIKLRKLQILRGEVPAI